jgi:colicin import membrane protein
MLKDRTYKKSFIFSVILHITLLSFLFWKFTQPSRFALTQNVAANIIKATVITSANLKPIVQPQPPTQQAIQQEQPKLAEQDILKQQQKQQQEEAAAAKLVELKAAQEKLAQEQAKKKATEQKKLLELKAQQEQEKKVLAEQKRKATLEQVMQQQMASEQQQLATQDQALQSEVDRYKALVLQAIQQHWIVPPNLPAGIYCLLTVEVAPGGDVIDIQVMQSSGNDLLDRSAKAAVLKASPLPVPENAALFDNFRSLRLTVRPEGVS